MEEFLIKQKKIRKKLFIVSLVIGVIATIMFVGLIIAGRVLSYNTKNSTLPYYGDGSVSGWATIFGSMGVIFNIIGSYFMLLVLILIPIIMYLSIILIWCIYGIYYVVKHNKIQKNN